MLTHTVGILCVLGAAACASGLRRRWQDLAALPLGFAVAVTWQPSAPAAAGGLALLAVLSLLIRPDRSYVGAAGAGVLAGLWAVWLHGLGCPWALALVLGAAVPVVAAWLSLTRPSFAPVRIREDALFAVGALGLVVAVGPTVTAGWSSAVALNLPRGGVAASGPGPWLFAAGAGVMLIGGVHSLWRRR